MVQSHFSGGRCASNHQCGDCLSSELGGGRVV